MAVCPHCGAPAEGREQCPACGALISGGEIELELAEPLPEPAPERPPDPVPERPPPLARPPDTRSWQERQAASVRDYWRVVRLPVVLILGWFTASHLVLGSTWVFIDHVNLALHEGGHFMFGLFGETMHFLGGTLGQLLFPAAFALYFWFGQRDRFAAVACAWWFGENFIGIARYMADAPTQALPLVGGNVHDWNHLLGQWGLLDSAGTIAGALRLLGIVIMLATLALLGYWTARPDAYDEPLAEP
jgi:hypothetical protein